MKTVFEKKWLLAVVIAAIFFAGVFAGAIGVQMVNEHNHKMVNEHGHKGLSFGEAKPQEPKKEEQKSTEVKEDKAKNEAESKPAPKATTSVPSEYKAALASAKTYSNVMHMSKQGIYDQLTSEYGGKFPADAAQYAIDNLNADYNKNALESAKVYQKMMHMSTEAIRDQLTSEYGGKFTEEEADYAVSNLPQ